MWLLVTASPDTRAQRLLHTAYMSEGDAKKGVAASDRDRRGSLKRFCQIDEEEPTHYDIVIYTGVLSSERAADLDRDRRPGRGQRAAPLRLGRQGRLEEAGNGIASRSAGGRGRDLAAITPC